MKEYFGEDYDDVQRRQLKCLSQSIDQSKSNKKSLKDIDSFSANNQFKIDIETTNPSYSLTRNNYKNRNIKTGYSFNRRQIMQQSKFSTLDASNTGENKSCIACVKTSSTKLNTTEKATLTKKSYFKEGKDKNTSFDVNLHNIEKWLDQKEMNLDQQLKI